MEPRCSVLALATSFSNDLEGFFKKSGCRQTQDSVSTWHLLEQLHHGGHMVLQCVYILDRKVLRDSAYIPAWLRSCTTASRPINSSVTRVRLELHMHKQTDVWRRTLRQGEEMAICWLKFKHFGLYFAPQFICVRQRLVSFSILRGVKNLT